MCYLLGKVRSLHILLLNLEVNNITLCDVRSRDKRETLKHLEELSRTRSIR